MIISERTHATQVHPLLALAMLGGGQRCRRPRTSSLPPSPCKRVRVQPSHVHQHHVRRPAAEPLDTSFISVVSMSHATALSKCAENSEASPRVSAGPYVHRTRLQSAADPRAASARRPQSSPALATRRPAHTTASLGGGGGGSDDAAADPLRTARELHDASDMAQRLAGRASALHGAVDCVSAAEAAKTQRLGELRMAEWDRRVFAVLQDRVAAAAVLRRPASAPAATAAERRSRAVHIGDIVACDPLLAPLTADWATTPAHLRRPWRAPVSTRSADWAALAHAARFDERSAALAEARAAEASADGVEAPQL